MWPLYYQLISLSFHSYDNFPAGSYILSLKSNSIIIQSYIYAIKYNYWVMHQYVIFKIKMTALLDSAFWIRFTMVLISLTTL